MKILEFLGLKKKKRIIINYNSEDFSDNEKLSTLLNENAYLKGAIARTLSEKKAEEEKYEESDKEQLQIKALHKDKIGLEEKDYPPLSLFNILKHQKDKKTKTKIKFTTFDGKMDLGEVEDFVIMPDGGFGVVSNDKVIWASNNINHVFYWVNGLNTFARNNIIQLCVNDKGQFEPNLQSEEISELVRTSDGKFKINRFSKKPLYEMVAGLHNDINELNQEIKTSESTLVEQQKEIYEKERESSLHKNRANKIHSELSEALEKVAEIEKANGQIVRQNMALVNLKDINEQIVDSLESAIEKWSGKIEDKFGKDLNEEVWEDLKSKLNWAKQNMPQTIYNLPEKEEKPSLTETTSPAKP